MKMRKIFLVGVCVAGFAVSPFMANAAVVGINSFADFAERYTNITEYGKSKETVPPVLDDNASEILSHGYGAEWELDEDELAELEEAFTETSPTPPADAGVKPYPEFSAKKLTGDVIPTFYGKYSGSLYFDLVGAGQVLNNTSRTNYSLLIESKKTPDLRLSNTDQPQVLIMHTHTTESYEPYERKKFDPTFNYRTTDESKSVVAVGEAIVKQLERAKIGVIHDTTIHDYPSYNGSYNRSAETVKEILDKYPTIKVVLDIHRDAINSSSTTLMQPTVTINGKKAAQVMIISGCDDGTMGMPDYLQNFRLATAFQTQIETDNKGLTRPILFDYRNYNQGLTTGSLLIEVGSHGNTIEQAVYSGELIGKSIATTLSKFRS
jgi:stage II sporulation protein P